MVKFINNLFSGPGVNVSSKRVFGGIGFICAIILVFMNPELTSTLLYVSASLLGLEAVTGMFKK